MPIGAQDYGIITTREVTTTFVDAVEFNAGITTYTSASFDISEFRNMCLYIALVITLTPTRLDLDIEFSDDDVTYYKLMTGPFANIKYSYLAGNRNEAIEGPLRAKYFRVKVTSTGTTAANKFTLTLKTFMS